jgi:hypothetical protein
VLVKQEERCPEFVEGMESAMLVVDRFSSKARQDIAEYTVMVAVILVIVVGMIR